MQNKKDYAYFYSFLIRCGVEEGINFCPSQKQGLDIWDGVLAATAYTPIDYEQFFINYQYAYLSLASHVYDFRLVILHDGKPVAVWPVVLLVDSNSSKPFRFGSNAGMLLNPLFVNGVSAATKQKIEKALYKTIIRFCAGVDIVCVEYGEMLGPITPYTSVFNAEMTRGAAQLNVSHFSYIHLQAPIEHIWANYRKSYKSLINAGRKIWSINLLDQENHDIWEQFHQLHVLVAGRETRSLATWDLQHKSIIERNGFLIYLQDDVGRMVGGGFFQHSRDEALYAVGAYDRNLFDRPLGHVVQHTAIVEMQKRNLKWYRLGQRFYSASVPNATDKEIAISLFKEGFATHQFVRVDSVTPVTISSV